MNERVWYMVVWAHVNGDKSCIGTHGFYTHEEDSAHGFATEGEAREMARRCRFKTPSDPAYRCKYTVNKIVRRENANGKIEQTSTEVWHEGMAA